MENKNIARYIVYSFIGFVILVVGGVMGKYLRDIEGIMQNLPYVFIGIGAGIFGQNIGTVFNIIAIKKGSKRAKQQEIEEKDERNFQIKNRAKSKAFDLMIIVFGALMFAFAISSVDMTLIISFVIAYLVIVCSYIYFVCKYNKEM